MRYIRVISTALILAAIFFTDAGFSQEEVLYKKFKLENVTCDAGVLYRNRMPEGMDIGVSAIATGAGAEFRRWEIAGIILSIDSERMKPGKTGKFYTRKESFFRVPAAVLFAAIGAQVDASGSGLEKGIAKAGTALGLGLLVLQARGEITGQNCIFSLNRTMADRIKPGRDFLEITVENKGLHLKEAVKIGIIKPGGKSGGRFNYRMMSRNELADLINTLDGQIVTLEKNQAAYKYGSDPEHDEIQRKIEKLQAEKGIAYGKWLEKQRPGR